MANPWMPGLIHDPGRGAGYQAGRNRMWMVVNHDTGGTNSYTICKDGRPGYYTGLCQILLPKVGVPWQFTEIDAICYHAGSAQYGDYNPTGPGFEVERLQGEDLSPDQTMWLGRIFAWMESEWGMPNVHYWGPRFPPFAAAFNGYVNHSQIHPNPDGLSIEEWDMIHASAPSPPQGVKPMYDHFETNPANRDEIWWFSGAGRRHVGPDEWANIQADAAFKGTPAPKPFAGTKATFSTVPEVG